MRVLPNVYSCFVCLNVCCFFIRETYTLLNQPPTSTVGWTNERTSKKRRTRYRNYLYSDTRRFFFLCLCLCLQFRCICICCCFERRWIQSTKMPGGRRGLVAPQNTFLENIIRRSNSQRKYTRFSSFSHFSAPFFTTRTPQYTHIWVVRLRNCKWFDQRSKNENKKKSNEYVIKGETKESWTNEEKEKLWIIKNSVKSPIEFDFDRKRKEKLKKVEWQVYRHFLPLLHRMKQVKGWLDILLLLFCYKPDCIFFVQRTYRGLCLHLGNQLAAIKRNHKLYAFECAVYLGKTTFLVERSIQWELKGKNMKNVTNFFHKRFDYKE